jgi:chromosome transmission fidelity protein 8
MPTIPLRYTKPSPTEPSPENPLPPLLHTPTGLAIVELQGTIHFPAPTAFLRSSSASTEVGKLVFPLYDPTTSDSSDTKWMKKVYLYVGKNQRMVGEIKKLGKPFAVIRKAENTEDRMDGIEGGDDPLAQESETDGAQEELHIVEIIRWKIVFSTRPEPVGSGQEEG